MRHVVSERPLQTRGSLWRWSSLLLPSSKEQERDTESVNSINQTRTQEPVYGRVRKNEPISLVTEHCCSWSMHGVVSIRLWNWIQQSGWLWRHKCEIAWTGVGIEGDFILGIVFNWFLSSNGDFSLYFVSVVFMFTFCVCCTRTTIVVWNASLDILGIRSFVVLSLY